MTQPSTATSQGIPFPTDLSLATYGTIHAMAGAKETRNRSESREQDEVCPHHSSLIPTCNAKPEPTKQNFHSSDEEQETSAAKPGRKKNPKCDQISPCFYSPTPSRTRSHRHRAYVSSLSSCFSESLCSSQAARRDQNRIAQREFRLRKQQRVCVTFVLIAAAMAGRV